MMTLALVLGLVGAGALAKFKDAQTCEDKNIQAGT